MTKQLNCVLLIDDNPDDNFFHERSIKKTGKVKEIVTVESGLEGLNYLKSHNQLNPHQLDFIFLDINMPGMNGWEFIEEYSKLEPKQKKQKVVVMLTTSINPDEQEKAMSIGSVTSFLSKPLTTEKFNSLLEQYYPDVLKE